MSQAPFAGPVTVMFTDIEGSTALWDTHEDAMRLAHRKHHRILTETAEEFSGKIVKDRGDGFMIVFADPALAVRAAATAQRRLWDSNWPDPIGEIRVRMALSTGVVEERAGDYYGPDVNKAARLEGISHGGQIVMAETTRALVSGRLGDGFDTKDLGLQRLKGVSSPERVYQLLAAGLPHEFPPLRGAIVKGRALPSFSTSFLGRGEEMDEISSLLDDGARLVTLLGPGGIGKTRLAVEAAATLEPAMAGGAFFADLAPVGSTDEFGLAFAEAVGVHPEGTADVFSLVAETITEPTLVVVDNFEHLVAASPSLAMLLAESQELKLLATSRTPLAISGERIFHISPLRVSPNGGSSAAVDLFRDRAGAHGAQLTEADDEAIRSICRRLDGLPLAIELVAARTRLLNVAEIDRMLSQSLDALGSGGGDRPERHRTIRNTIDWSLQTLTDSQRQLFARLSALPAGADLATLEKVCCEGLDGSILDNLTALVDNSLVYSVTDLPGGTRFRQLSLLREYGAELLAGSGETDATLDRLIDHYVGIGPELREGLQCSTAVDAEIAVDHANLVTALQWSLQRGRVEEMARMLMEIWIYWFNGDRVSTAVDWLSKAEKQADSEYLDWLAGFLAFQKADFATVAERMPEALSRFTRSGDERGQALAMAFVSVAEDDPVEARRMLESAESTFVRIDDLVGRYVVLLFQSVIDFQEGDIEASLEKRKLGLKALQETDYEIMVAWMRWNMALSYLALGQPDVASGLVAEAFDYMSADGYHEGVASAGQLIAVIESLAGRHERAARLLGACAAIFDRIGTAPWFEAAVHVESTSAAARASLGEEVFERLFSDGTSFNLAQTEELSSLALAEQPQKTVA